MTTKNKIVDDGELGLGDDPLGDLDPLVEHFYKPAATPSSSSSSSSSSAQKSAKARAARGKGRQPLPDGQTYRLVTFSFYEDDVARLDALLAEAKKRGHRKVSRSQIVRLALRNVDLSRLPEVI